MLFKENPQRACEFQFYPKQTFLLTHAHCQKTTSGFYLTIDAKIFGICLSPGFDSVLNEKHDDQQNQIENDVLFPEMAKRNRARLVQQ